jgi:hypothetical protein
MVRKWLFLCGIAALCLVLPVGIGARAQDRDDLKFEAGKNRQTSQQTQLRQAQQTRQRRTRPEAPKVGEEAPDFTLPAISVYDFMLEGKTVTRENAASFFEPVTLSDFKGKKPVALIFGSFT